MVLGTNILSNFVYQYHIQYHYSAIAVPAIVMGTAYAIEAMQPKWRRWMHAAVGVDGGVGVPDVGHPAHRSAHHPWCRPAARAAGAHVLAPRPPAWRSTPASCSRSSPADASVSAYHSLTAHLAHREQIYQFPNPFRVVLYGPDTQMEAARACIPEANDLQYVMLKAELDESSRPTGTW